MRRIASPIIALLACLCPGLSPALAQGAADGAVEPATVAQCPDNMTVYADSDESLTCTCPTERMASGSVWGSDVYTADSATCRAAQHAGVLTRRGGTVVVHMLPGQERYPGTTRNGVRSSNYGARSQTSLILVGLQGNKRDAWIQIDDAAVRCRRLPF